MTSRALVRSRRAMKDRLGCPICDACEVCRAENPGQHLLVTVAILSCAAITAALELKVMHKQTQSKDAFDALLAMPFCKEHMQELLDHMEPCTARLLELDSAS